MDGTFSTSTTKLDMDETLIIKGRRFTRSHLIALIVAAIFIVITIILLIALAVVASNNKHDAGYTSTASASRSTAEKADVCVTAACANAASTMLEAMDDTAEPCDDFYQYACGGWMTKNVIPEYRSALSQFSKLGDQQAIQLRGLLEEESQPTDPKPITESRDMYKACVDEDTIEELGVQPLRDLHDHLGGWPITDETWNDTDFDLYHTLSELRLLSNEYLVDVWVSADDRDNTKNVVQLDQFHLSLPSRDYYLKRRFSKELEAYRTLITEIAEYLGANKTTVKQDVDDLIEFETYMANITAKLEHRRDLHSLYRRYKVSELYTEISDKFDWKPYLNKLFAEIDYTFYDSTEVVVYAPDFLTAMAEKVANTSPRVLANYLVWRITEYRITNLPQAVIDIQNKFYRVAYSIPEEAPRWLRCVNYVNGAMGFAVGRLFVDKYFRNEAKKEMTKMTDEVQSAFDEMIEEAGWMVPATQQFAKEKRAAMGSKIGYPEWLYNETALHSEYQGLEFKKDQYFANHLAYLKWIEVKGFKKIVKPVDQDRWVATPAEIDAYYSGELNEIILPAGALQPPFYQKDQPMSLNYGGIGTFIGHAITHGFDDQGRMFDKNGNIKEWWDNATVNAFHHRAQCIIDQYSNYVVPEIHENINGVNTQGENIADNGAMRVGYRAFIRHEQKHGAGQRLPGLTQFDSKQLFFLNLAQIDCQISRISQLKASISNGYHSPGRFRVIGTLSNFPEFSKAFSCPAKSPMNPEKKCTVW